MEDWEKTEVVSITIPKYLVDELDGFSKKWKQSRSKIISEAVAIALNQWRKEGSKIDEMAQGS